MAKKRKIVLPEEHEPIQSNLFQVSGVSSYPDGTFPPVFRDLGNWRRILNSADRKLGLDYEFPPSFRASVIGISTLRECAAVRATPDLIREVVQTARQKHLRLVGHSVFENAEVKVTEVNTGIRLGLDEIDDSMLKHYLLNQDLCKAPDKEEDDSGALGFMNLWSMTSLLFDVPNWKQCRGKACDEVICPVHDNEGYCAVDSWASVASDESLSGAMQTWGIRPAFYEDLKELTWLAGQMKQQGIRVNMDWVRQLETGADQLKDKLFPYEQHGKKQVYKEFNPKSHDQVIEWFANRGVSLSSTDKNDIRKCLESQSKKHGINTKGEKGGFTTSYLDSAESLNPLLETLYRLYQYKNAGKGLGSWFDEKHLDRNGLIHPRFITVGTSTGRWSSSGPNFQNIPARGFGALVRAAIVARDSSLQLLKADFSQLELRMCLYLAGVDPAIIGKDAFSWLVSEAGGLFDRAAELYAGKPRDIAKSVSHAGDYLEGLRILAPIDLQRPNIKREIEYGALRVYLKKYIPSLKSDWTFRGGIVAFTGANLAERLFGDRTLANRKKALEIQEDIYFAKFPIRDWHRKVLSDIETSGVVKSPTGRFLRLYGKPEDDCKMAAAFLGQGVSADHVQGITLRFWRERHAMPIMQVHDELVFEIPRDWEQRQTEEFIGLMGEETDRLPGFKSAAKAYRGDNWLEDTKGEHGVEGAMKEICIIS